jgi:mono/diheme cytochrome c family protein
MLRALSLLGLASLLVAAGCTRIDKTLGDVAAFSTMNRAPSLSPYEMPRPAPAHSVPFNSPVQVDWRTFPSNFAGLDSLAAVVSPPAPLASFTPAELKRGEGLFDRFCMVCHGPAAKGNGPIVGGGKFPFAPDLTAQTTVQRSDGYIYSMIRMGRGLMPPYGERLDNEDRWYVVAYVRQLQREAAQGTPPRVITPVAGFNGWAAPARGMVNVPANALIAHPGGQPEAAVEPPLWTTQWAETGYYGKKQKKAPGGGS